MQLYEHHMTIRCPIDGKPKTVYCRTLIYNGVKRTICLGCDIDAHGGAKCTTCSGNVSVESIDRLLSDGKIYPPYVE